MITNTRSVTIDGISSQMKIRTLLYKGLPAYRHPSRFGILKTKQLADALGITRQAVNRWIAVDTLSYRQVKKLMDLPGSTLTAEQLIQLTD